MSLLINTFALVALLFSALESASRKQNPGTPRSTGGMRSASMRTPSAPRAPRMPRQSQQSRPAARAPQRTHTAKPSQARVRKTNARPVRASTNRSASKIKSSPKASSKNKIKAQAPRKTSGTKSATKKGTKPKIASKGKKQTPKTNAKNKNKTSAKKAQSAGSTKGKKHNKKAQAKKKDGSKKQTTAGKAKKTTAARGAKSKVVPSATRSAAVALGVSVAAGGVAAAVVVSSAPSVHYFHPAAPFWGPRSFVVSYGCYWYPRYGLWFYEPWGCWYYPWFSCWYFPAYSCWYYPVWGYSVAYYSKPSTRYIVVDNHDKSELWAAVYKKERDQLVMVEAARKVGRKKQMKLFLKDRDHDDVVVIAKSEADLTTSLPIEGNNKVTIIKQSDKKSKKDSSQKKISDPDEKQIAAFREKILKEGTSLPAPQEAPEEKASDDSK